MQFDDGACGKFLHRGESIRVEVSLHSTYRAPVQARDQGVPVAPLRINDLNWINYSSPKWVEDCTFFKDEQVCIYGGKIPADEQVSDGLLKAVKEMESTFTFTSSGRLDSRIAALAVGARFGRLRIRRVVTRQMETQHPGEGYDGQYGEVFFAGTLTLTGTLENLGTMNSGARWAFFPDFEDAAQWPFPVGRERLSRIEFHNGSYIGEQLEKMTPAPIVRAGDREATIVMNDVAIFFNPDADGSFVTANLVKMAAL